ncbi:MAG: hypothetical protein Fur0032_25070 [Terrimicrobiaceae bacterium]
MKKTLVPILCAAILLVGFSIYWITGRTAVSDGAALVPDRTMVFAMLPDLPRAAMRWPKTSLGLVSAEPEVVAFFEKPMEVWNASSGNSRVTALLGDLRPGRVFFAIPSAQDTKLRTLLGFQYWGEKKAFDAAIQDLRARIANDQPVTVETQSHQGVEIQSSTLGNGEALYTAASSRWGFLSNDLDTLRDALERLHGRAASPALAADADYQKALTSLDPEADFLAFLRPDAAIDFLLNIGSQMGAQPDPAQLEQVRRARSVAYSIRLDGPAVRDSLVFSIPDSQPAPALGRETLRLTSPTTLAFFHFAVDAQKTLGMLKAVGLDQRLGDSAARVIDRLEESAGLLGTEGGLALAWPSDAMLPRAVAGISINDPTGAEALLNEFREMVPGMTVSDTDGLKIYSIPALRSPFSDPGFAFTPTLAVGSSSSEDLVDILKHPDVANLTANPAFAALIPEFEAANESFGFVDTRAIFERAFPMLRQVIVFGSSLLPGASDLIDPDKIPSTESIAKHLIPFAYSQSRDTNGVIIRSSGPVSMNHAAVILAIGSAAALPPGVFLRPQS